jgi:mono/diheme cytochrome c family protein
MLKNSVFLVVGLTLAVAVSAEEQHKQIQYVPVKSISPVSGEQMYTVYCAVCHGNVGKSDGPAAEALKVPPPDLTVLARNNGGKYPYDHIRCAIEGDICVPTRGPKEMPLWGELFWRMSQGHRCSCGSAT